MLGQVHTTPSEHRETHCAGFCNGLLQTVEINELDVAKTFRFVVSVLDNFDRFGLMRDEIRMT